MTTEALIKTSLYVIPALVAQYAIYWLASSDSLIITIDKSNRKLLYAEVWIWLRNWRRSRFVQNSSKVLKYLIPSKHREEIIGDWNETKAQMEEDGIHGIWRICTLAGLALQIGLGIIRLRLSDLYRAGSRKRID